MAGCLKAKVASHSESEPRLIAVSHWRMLDQIPRDFTTFASGFSHTPFHAMLLPSPGGMLVNPVRQAYQSIDLTQGLGAGHCPGAGCCPWSYRPYPCSRAACRETICEALSSLCGQLTETLQISVRTAKILFFSTSIHACPFPHSQTKPRPAHIKLITGSLAKNDLSPIVTTSACMLRQAI